MKTSEILQLILQRIESKADTYICYALRYLTSTEAVTNRQGLGIEDEVEEVLGGEASVQQYLMVYMPDHLPESVGDWPAFSRSVRIFWLRMWIHQAQLKGD